jgi:hypothetical protein
MIRVILAGILGGIVIFFCGFVEHAVLELQARAVGKFSDEPTFVETVREQKLEPGIYGFPEMPVNIPAAEKEAAQKAYLEKFKVGPNGMLVVWKTSDQVMDPKLIGMEAATNVAAALLCSFILACMSPRNGFTTRLAVCFLIGLISWLSIEASYGIWYQFPNLWVMDGLIGSLAEWLIAGVLMSAIVKPFYPEPALAPVK